MSQEGLIDVIGTHPQIPTEFIADSGTAVPIANQLEVLGESVAAGTNPFRSIASGNTVTYQVQRSQATAATDVSRVGLAAFDSSSFSVDANGFVTFIGSSSSVLVTTYTTGTGNWIANPRTTYVEVLMWGGGGGGGSGRRGTSAASGGGGGGGGGAFIRLEGPVSAFSGTLSYTVGAAVSGGAARTTDATNGAAGTAGNNTIFGSAIALGGNPGQGGINSGGTSGGVTRSNLTNFSTSTLASGGANGNLGNGGNAGNAGSTNQTISAATGGGGGGGGNTGVFNSGGTGGGILDSTNANIVAPAAGGIESGTINGTNGSSLNALGGIYGGGMGGGGGGGARAGAAAGKGGDGSSPGGGGGGGGGGLDAQANSGAGGQGAAGRIVVIEYF